MRLKKQDGIEWLEFELLAEDPYVIHGVFLRYGGVSEGVFSSLNLTRKAGDDPKNVFENRSKVKAALGLHHISSAYHVHGDHLESIAQHQEEVLNADGLMTQSKEIGLLATHADCQAAIFYDPIRKAIACVHAGWRGQVQGIYQKTIAKMGKEFGSTPQDLLVCISPSLGPENSEFKNYSKELPESFWPFQIKPTYFDLWAIAQHQLESAGVLTHHIEIARMDTFANPTQFFSYRRQKALGATDEITGCHGTVVALKN